ncbi:MAG: hypothetical protein K9M97_09285 [Akkermansiaceae bacterium]|nr:hypothetical protein [Akkermansiaceae bacterium]
MKTISPPTTESARSHPHETQVPTIKDFRLDFVLPVMIGTPAARAFEQAGAGLDLFLIL